MRLGVLVSGRGSNLEAVLRARPRNVEPVLVIANRPAARALQVAEQHGVPRLVLRLVDFDGDPGRRDAAIGSALTEAGVELALLAGWDQVLHPSYFERFAGRTVNIHPSLLPRHGGVGMVGMAVHRSVLESGDRETGATVHLVTQDVDAGPLLAQARVPVLADDSPGSLAERVLRAEHRLVVDTLRRLASGEAGPEDGASMARGASAARDST